MGLAWVYYNSVFKLRNKYTLKGMILWTELQFVWPTYLLRSKLMW